MDDDLVEIDFASGSFFDGWWRTKKTGGMHPDGDLIMGDEPADIMGEALSAIQAAYQERWDREPSKEELRRVFNFVLAPMPE